MYNRLTNKEYEIMRYIWDNDDGITLSELCACAKDNDDELKPQTVNTHIYHLIEKGFVRSEGSQRKHCYYPKVPRAEYDSYLANRIVRQVFGGSLKKFIAAFALNRSLTGKEVSELKALIKKKKEN